MIDSARPPGQRLLSLWRKTSSMPMGRTVFMWLFRQTVPYSGALGARVIGLEPGHCRIELRQRRAVQNHLDSVHAIALANLGEMASGLAMTTALPAGVRGIVTHMKIEFSKKARGVLTAESHITVPQVTGDVEHDVHADIRDEAGESVATVAVRWRLGLIEPSS